MPHCQKRLGSFMGSRVKNTRLSFRFRYDILVVMSKYFKDKKEYYSWWGMIDRCTNKKNVGSKYYLSKGVTVCDRWTGAKGFHNFLADMGKRPQAMTLDRIDNTKGYSPENCKWSTRTEQSRNRDVVAEVDGKKVTLRDMSEKLNIPLGTLKSRIHRGTLDKVSILELFR